MHLNSVYLRVLEDGVTYNSEDLFMLPQEDPKWVLINESVEYVTLGKSEHMLQQNESFSEWIKTMTGMNYYAMSASTKVGKTLLSIWAKIHMYFCPSVAYRADALFKKHLCLEKARGFMQGV